MDLPTPLAAVDRPAPPPSRPRGSRGVVRILLFAAVLLLAYAVWRGYQNPDLLLNLASFRLC